MAIATIGAAISRRCFLLIQGEPLFANFYLILVGPPGTGKTRAIRFGKELLAGLKDFQLSPNALTKEKLISNLASSTKVVPGGGPGQVNTMTSYCCMLDELSTFIKHKDYEFMTNLTDLFDCPKVWEYETLTRGTQRIENLCLTIVGGITPKNIQVNWGEAAIGMGFTARLNMIYSEDVKHIDLFGIQDVPDFSKLAHDLAIINKLEGRMSVTKEAAEYLQSWVSAGMPPIPADSRFAEYNPRRSIHWLKLCMVYSIAESNDLVITLDHVKRAQETLLEAEAGLPFAFEHMGQNPLLAAINAVHKWMKIEYGTTRTPIIEQRIRRRLLSDVPPQYVDAVINELVSSGLAQVSPTQRGKVYTPNMTRMGLDDNQG